MRSLIPLEIIATEICEDIEDALLKHKFKITRYLIDAYQEMHMFLDGDFSVKTQILSFDNVVCMPDDFVFATKVGMLCNGCITNLTLMDGLKYQKCNNTATKAYFDDIWSGNNRGDQFVYYNAFRNGSSLGELYGYGRGVYAPGYYDIDKKNGNIYIGSEFPRDAEIIVEYKSDGISDGLKLVPSEWKKAMKYYGKSEFYADRNITQSQINRNNYEREYNKVQRLNNFKTALYMSAEVSSMYSPTNY